MGLLAASGRRGGPDKRRKKSRSKPGFGGSGASQDGSQGGLSSALDAWVERAEVQIPRVYEGVSLLDDLASAYLRGSSLLYDPTFAFLGAGIIL